LIQVGAAALFGALMMIPSLIALPLAGSLIDAGVSYTPVAAFITTLTEEKLLVKLQYFKI
jgi:uncharacterized membrane protein YraQ (UPF0718 family)